MDLYCKVCGEPWDMLSIKEDFTEEEKEQFFKGKGCPACKGIPTMYCEHCDRAFKGWMQKDLIEEFGTKDVIELIWKHKTCPYCSSKLKIAVYDGEFIESLIENEGALEDIMNTPILDLI